MSARLDVWCMGVRAGELRDEPGGMVFAYADDWVAAGRSPLSQSLPVSGAFSTAEVHAFFGGLLPEATPRDLLARQLGVSSANEFALLELIGGDCAGAVSVLPPGERPEDRPASVEWLDDEALARLIVELPRRPMHADEGGEYRLSLAGAQDKLPVVVDGEGRIGLPAGSRPSTHVLKTPIAGLPATVLNEAFCLSLGTALGVNTVRAQPRRVGDQELLLVERYDRQVIDGTTTRLHQEDICQALGIPSERKYEREGGPGIAECFAVVDGSTTVPALDKAALLDGWALSFLVGNHDAHGKNFSLLYAHGETVVAPIYDVLSTVVYWKVKEMDRKTAMHVGGEYRPAYVQPRHLDAMVTQIGMNVRLVRKHLLGLANRAVPAAEAVRDRFRDELWWDPFLDKIVETVAQRAQWLGEMCASPAQRSAAGQTRR